MSHPWMPLYVGDYLADTGHLSTLEHGAYMLLIMNYWQHGSLPQDDEDLSIIARLSLKDWQRMRNKIARLFLPEWKHKRVEAELAETTEKYTRRASAGKQGGIAKAKRLAEAKQNPSIATSYATSNATPELGNTGNNRLAKLKHPATNSQLTPTTVGNPSQTGTDHLENLGGELRPSVGGPRPTEPSDPAWDDDAPFGSEAAA